MAQELIRSTGSDGKEVLSNILDRYTGEKIEYKEVTGISDSDIDGVVYIKKYNKYYVRSEFLANSKINVKWFGVKGDGVTDDAPILNGILEVFSNLSFPTGTYRAASPLIVKKEDTKLIGTGKINNQYPNFLTDSEYPSSLFIDHPGSGVVLSHQNPINGFFTGKLNYYTTNAERCFDFNLDGVGSFRRDFTFDNITIQKFNAAFEMRGVGSGSANAMGIFVCKNSSVMHNKQIHKQTVGQWNGFKMLLNEAGSNNYTFDGFYVIDVRGTSINISDNILEGQRNPIRILSFSSSIEIKNNYFEKNVGDQCILINGADNYELGPNYYADISIPKIKINDSYFGNIKEDFSIMNSFLSDRHFDRNNNQNIKPNSLFASNLSYDFFNSGSIARTIVNAESNKKIIKTRYNASGVEGRIRPNGSLKTFNANINYNTGDTLVFCIAIKRNIESTLNPYITIRPNNTTSIDAAFPKLVSKCDVHDNLIIYTLAVKALTDGTTIGSYVYAYGLTVPDLEWEYITPSFYVLDEETPIFPVINVDVSDLPVQNTYTTEAAMYGAQINQSKGFIYHVSSIGYFEYLGTNTGDSSDYRSVGNPTTSGPTTTRPVVSRVGYEHFDTTLKRPIWWNGTAWVDLFVPTGGDIQIGSTPSFTDSRPIKIFDNGLNGRARITMIGTSGLTSGPAIEALFDGLLSKRVLIRADYSVANGAGWTFFHSTPAGGTVAGYSLRGDGALESYKKVISPIFEGGASGLTGFNTVDGFNIVGEGDIPSRVPNGFKDQSLFYSENASKSLEAGDNFLEIDVIETADELLAAKEKVFNLQIVFEQWELFSHYTGPQTDFPSPQTQPAFNEKDTAGNILTPEVFYAGDVWKYSEPLDGILLGSNFTPYTGFVSPTKYRNYNLAATLSSDNPDDDLIGIIIAFSKDSQGIERTLSVIRTPNTGGSIFPGIVGYGIYLDYFQDSQELIANGSTLVAGIKGGWNAVGSTRVSVERVENIITVKCSDFGSATLNTNSTLTVDLTQNAKLDVFMDGASIGFSASSQQNALINNIDFDGFSLQFVDIVDREAPKVWQLAQGSLEYVVNTEIAINDIIPKNRWVFSKSTQKLFAVTPFGILGGYKVGSALSTSPVETDFPIRLFASLGGSGAEYTFTEIFARYYRVGERLFFELGFTVDTPRPDRPGDFGIEMQHGYTSLDSSDLGSIQMDYYNNLGETVYNINPFIFDNNILFAVKKGISNTSYNPRLLATSITSGTSIRVSGNFLSKAITGV